MPDLPYPGLRESTTRWGRLFLFSAAVGVLAGLAAAGMHHALAAGTQLLIGRYAHLGGTNVFLFHAGVLVLPTLGGLLTGLLVRLTLPPSTHHGTNQYVHAFHHRAGRLGLKDPLTRALATVGLISCGGSAGPEGPMSALGASIGSALASWLRLSPQYRRVLLVAGCGGGIGAIFQCPLGGALFASSVLYREPAFEAESMVPAFVASVTSYATFMFFPGFGHHLLEGTSSLVFSKPIELVPYLILGPLCGLASIWFYVTLKAVESRPLKSLRLPPWLSPAVGGLLVGVLGCALPQVMDGRYQFIQTAVQIFSRESLPDAHTWWSLAALFGLVAVGKCIATALTVGTGGAGGVLGPTVFIGGATGAFLAALVEACWPGQMPRDLAPSLVPVGMAGVLAASMRTPLAAVVMVTEMTGSYGLIVPLMLVCVTSYVIGRPWGLNAAQVRSAAESPAHVGDTLIHLLESLRVEDLMARDWPLRVQPATPLGELISYLQPGHRPVFAVLDHDRLVGLISVSDMIRIMNEPLISDLVIASDIMTTRLVVIHPDQDLYSVLEVFRTVRHEALPVVTNDGKERFLGMLTRQAIHQAVHARSEEMRSHLHREHAGIAAIEQDEQMYQLMVGVSAPGPDTIQRIAVPAEAIGRSLRDADFRQQFGAQVIAVQQPDGRLQCPPDIDAPLRRDQFLLVILPTFTSAK